MTPGDDQQLVGRVLFHDCHARWRWNGTEIEDRIRLRLYFNFLTLLWAASPVTFPLSSPCHFSSLLPSRFNGQQISALHIRYQLVPRQPPERQKHRD